MQFGVLLAYRNLHGALLKLKACVVPVCMSYWGLKSCLCWFFNWSYLQAGDPEMSFLPACDTIACTEVACAGVTHSGFCLCAGAPGIKEAAEEKVPIGLTSLSWLLILEQMSGKQQRWLHVTIDCG
jgi:hypothetical protein